MKRLFAVSLLLALGYLTLLAVPAYPVKKRVRLVDGSELLVTLVGDEFAHYYVTADGAAVNEVEGGLYARLSTEELMAMQQRMSDKQEQANLRRAAKGRQRHQAPLVGEKRGLVVLVNFTDNAFSIENPQAAFSDCFNKSGYNEYGMTGSVSDYFREQSYGQFNLKFDVAGPYTLPHNMVYYGGPSGSYHDIRPQEMIADAVQLADADVDFTRYDWDGDGEVDQIFVIYAGYGENYGAPSHTMWPHESSIAYQNLVLDGMHIGTYATSCELFGTKGAEMDGIGTACHEFSHCLGIMDHYDMNGKNFGMGTWDVMCRGTYNNEGRTPAAYTAYERWVSGWLEPVVVSSPTQIKGMKALTEAPEAYLLYNEGHKDEYLLLENRQQRGFDAALGGHGLLVVHVDYDKDSWAANTINSTDIQRMTLIAADDEYSYLAEASLAGDPFPGTRGVTSLMDYTTPAALLHHANEDGSLYLHKAIESIKEDEQGDISMLLCAKPLAVPVLQTKAVTSTSFQLAWETVEDATSYELSLDEVSKRGGVEASLILGEDFEPCYSQTVGTKDISKDLTPYLPGYSGSMLFTTPNFLRIGSGASAGCLVTPQQQALGTGDLTIVMKVKPYKTGTAVKGDVKITTGTASTSQTFSFSFSEETTLVFHSEVQFHEAFTVTIAPTKGMYISGLYLYDGNFTEQELGLDTRGAAPRRVVIQTMTTEVPSYTFTDLNPNCNYAVRIRSLAPDRSSQWSAWYSIADPTLINEIKAESPLSDTYYDLQGRRISAPSRGLYLHRGKKVILK